MPHFLMGTIRAKCAEWIGQLSDRPSRHFTTGKGAVTLGRAAFCCSGTVGEELNWVPWIHIDDEVGIILHLLEREDLEGPFNLSAPNPVQYRDYVRMMGELVGKPTNRKMPAFMMELFMGETTRMVLHNRRMIPQRALETGYVFRFPKVKGALDDLSARGLK